MKQKITTPQAAAELLRPLLTGLDHEVCYAVFLTNANTVLSVEKMTEGTLTSVPIDHRRIAKNAILQNAASVIISHNHPSGEPEPGTADVKATEKLQDALGLFDIKLMDHIVITDDGFYSFTDDNRHNFS